MDVLFSIAIILFAGLLFSKLVKRLNQPDIIGYLIAGIVIGPSVLNLVNYNQIDKLDTFGIIALSFIAFLIGSQFKLKYIKKLGAKPFVITLFSCLCTLILVSLSLFLAGNDLAFSLLLGAIASSTAPAVAMIVIKENRARGSLTNTILSVIAIDDILAIVIFGFCLVFAENLTNNNIVLTDLAKPFIEIILSILFGIGTGLLLGMFVKKIKSDNNVITLIIAFVFLTIVVTDYYNVSSLLVCMIMGGVFINYFQHRTTDKVLDLIDYIIPPILAIFFVISGASLNFSLIPSVWLICLLYILTRMVGKIFGSYLGSVVSKEEVKITKYLGPTLLSQTGLAVGLAVIASSVLKDSGNNIETILIASSFIFDLFTPSVTKKMLKNAKEIK
jgi:Kef-type K+ transport system membrane component KefB